VLALHNISVYGSSPWTRFIYLVLGIGQSLCACMYSSLTRPRMWKVLWQPRLWTWVHTVSTTKLELHLHDQCQRQQVYHDTKNKLNSTCSCCAKIYACLFIKHERKRTYNVTLRGVRLTIVNALETQPIHSLCTAADLHVAVNNIKKRSVLPWQRNNVFPTHCSRVLKHFVLLPTPPTYLGLYVKCCQQHQRT
jgi:hypothetical protein